MACHGSKVLQSRRRRHSHSNDDDDVPSRGRQLQERMRNRKWAARNGRKQWDDEDRPSRGGSSHQTQSSQQTTDAPSQHTTTRRKVDPDTIKYFTEIASLLEGDEMDLEERAVMCGNALEETKGKELELACDKILSHVLETILKSCNIDELCSFLRSSAKWFPVISVDQAGSHVAETALTSLSSFLNDEDNYSTIGHALAMVCQELAGACGSVMFSCYGSHVFRSILCLCKGIKLDGSENFHSTKSATVLAERLSGRPVNLAEKCSVQGHQGFPELFRCLITGILDFASVDISNLQVSSYGALVLQTVLKLLAGDDEELFHIIPVLLGCNESTSSRLGEYLEVRKAHDILDLLKDTAFSHLMEVILQVAPDALYEEIFVKVFKCCLVKVSSHHCGNFVIQALISSARSNDQIISIWEELGPNIKDLLKMRKPGVVASLVAACRRFQTHEKECSRAFAASVHSESEPPSCIVPRVLFLENYYSSEDKANWTWPTGMKVSVLGCLILQTIFGYRSKFIHPFVSSILAMESAQVLEVAKDPGGGRVLEAFLASDVSAKRKYKMIAKLEGHFGELALRPSGSFTVEKCFASGSLSLKELIVSELSSVQVELSRTKHGPHLLKKFDVSRFSTRPEQWRSMQASRQSTQKEFSKLFSSNNKSEGSRPLHSSHLDGKSKKRKGKGVIAIDGTDLTTVPLGSEMLPDLELSMAKLGFPMMKLPKEHINSITEPTVGLKEETENILPKRKRSMGIDTSVVLQKDEAGMGVSKEKEVGSSVTNMQKKKKKGLKRKELVASVSSPSKREKSGVR